MDLPYNNSYNRTSLAILSVSSIAAKPRVRAFPPEPTRMICDKLPETLHDMSTDLVSGRLGQYPAQNTATCRDIGIPQQLARIFEVVYIYWKLNLGNYMAHTFPIHFTWKRPLSNHYSGPTHCGTNSALYGRERDVQWIPKCGYESCQHPHCQTRHLLHS